MGLEYSSRDIEVLEGLKAVRKRPGMYIGSTGKRGLHHLVYEVVDNSIDEAMAGYCDKIKITIHKDNSVTVEDNGRGIPIDTHPEIDKSGVEIVMTKLHAGGKFDNKSYKVSGGLHGVGVSVVNALSEYLEVKVKRDGGTYKQKYKKGLPQTELQEKGKTQKTGTQITFKPDHEIFDEINYDYNTLSKRIRELAFLNKGLEIKLIDKRTQQKNRYHYEGGIKSFVQKINEKKETIHPEPIYFKEKNTKTEIEAAIQYTNDYNENIYTFANNINTIEGGTHLSGFKSALTRTINKYAKQEKIIKKDEKLKGTDVREGITAILSIKLQEPQFEGQTKTKLGNSEIRGKVRSAVNKNLEQYLIENPKQAKKITKKAKQAMKARQAAKEAKELTRRKTALETTTLPGKLADCTTKDPDKAELFVVEGDSAGGCFTGETEIQLASGQTKTFKQLVEEKKEGETHYCYTVMNDGSIGIEEIKNPRVTKEDAELIEVEIDNGSTIECTPDHKFMLRTGEYKEAQNLETGDSLMPLYTKKSDQSEDSVTIDGYEMVKQPNRDNFWEFTHLLADRYNLYKGLDSKENGSHRHHVDFDKSNNSPENIERVGKEEHMEIHREQAAKTLQREEVREKLRELRKTDEFREKMSERMKQPETVEVLREQAKEQWEDEEYVEYMVDSFLDYYEDNKEEIDKRLIEKSREYWSSEKHRKEQSKRITEYYENNPEAKEKRRQESNEQWDDEELREWRSKKTEEQWTDEFRESRKEAYNQTYFENTIPFMKDYYEENGNLKGYDEYRAENGGPNTLTVGTTIEKFFDDKEELIETLESHNHKVVSVDKIEKTADVYDLEVPGTHNFALASGVFVHNSAKQARDREHQAILPLKGKILNAEKARLDKILENKEIKSLIKAIGTGIGEEFDLSKRRYSKIITMSVDGDDQTLIKTPSGEVNFVKIGEFIDDKITKNKEINEFKVLCFDKNTLKTRFKPIKDVIRHQLDEDLYEIKTQYGRKIRATSSHSVFVYEDDEIKLKKGEDIEPGDEVVAPKKLPSNEQRIKKIDVLKELIKNKDEITNDIYIRGEGVEELLKERVREEKEGKDIAKKRIELTQVGSEKLNEKRKQKGLTQKQICKQIGVKQPITLSEWERGIHSPPLDKFKKLCETIDISFKDIKDELEINKSILEEVWGNQCNKAPRNRVKDYIKISELNKKDLERIPENTEIEIKPEHHKDEAIDRYISVDENLMELLGIYVADGSFSLRNGIRIATSDEKIKKYYQNVFKKVFGVKGKKHESNSGAGEVKLLNRAAAVVWKHVFDIQQGKTADKEIPNIVFNVSRKNKCAFLKGYLKGDGTISDSITWTTVSEDLANGLMYLLSTLGVTASHRTINCLDKVKLKNRDKYIETKQEKHSITVSEGEDLEKIKDTWKSFDKSEKLERKYFNKDNREFKELSDNLVALKVKDIEKTEPTKPYVYDFSVEKDENFVAGFGGICAHNTDADVDGAHITTLLLTFLYRYMKPLIEEGMIYIGKPPLYQVKKGSKSKFVYTEKQKQELLEEWGGGSVQRYKGLGEMSPEQLWKTTMNPENRVLMKVRNLDDIESDEIFNVLMGKKVTPRRNFIMQNASEVSELDI